MKTEKNTKEIAKALIRAINTRKFSQVENKEVKKLLYQRLASELITLAKK